MTLRLCSLAARGLWIEMLSIMGISEKIGYLQIGGKPITVEQLSIMAGVSIKDAQKYMDELESNGVFSRDDDGIIFNRRMVRESNKYSKAVEFGKLGGNPVLISESRIQNPESRSKKLEATDGLTPGVKGRVKGQLTYTSKFLEFWQEYPNKTGKGKAFESWRKCFCESISVDVIASVQRQKQCQQWTKDNGQYIPNPATWLNQRRWEDEGLQTIEKKSTRIYTPEEIAHKAAQEVLFND